MPRNPESCQILPVTTTIRCSGQIPATHRVLSFLASLRGGKPAADCAVRPAACAAAARTGWCNHAPDLTCTLACGAECVGMPPSRFVPGALPYPCIASSVKSITADSPVTQVTPIPGHAGFRVHAGLHRHVAAASPASFVAWASASRQRPTTVRPLPSLTPPENRWGGAAPLRGCRRAPKRAYHLAVSRSRRFTC